MYDKKSVKIIQKALNALGKKNFTLIIHGGSFPAIENTGFGSMNSDGAKSLMDYISGIFNSIQLGPAGKTKSCDSSPYTSTIFSANPLFVDLKALTTKKWGNILSEKTFLNIVENNPQKNVNKTAYSYAYNKYSEALDESYKNFINLNDKTLKKEFENFKNKNNSWLDKDSLYEALSIEHGNDYFPAWKSEVDKNLFNPNSIEERMKNGERINEISQKYVYEIDKYKFIQFVLSKQSLETIDYAKSKELKLIADRQVAFSDRDIWAYQSLFLKGWKLGCPPDYFSKNGQGWGFPVLDPEKLYKDNGDLADGGILLKALFRKMFKENSGGVRIDHIVGLIDPWVYKEGKNPKIDEGAGRLYSSPEHNELKKYAVISEENLNYDVDASNELRVKNLTDEQIKLYGRFIEKIVIAAAKEEGLDEKSIVCEDLGTLTNPVAEVMKKYNLLGMRLTQFVVAEDENHPYRCKNICPNCWVMAGTHDNAPVTTWAKACVNTHNGYLHVKNLVEDLYKDVENKDDLIVEMTQNVEKLKFAKFVELFAANAENVQIFFTDFFNIEDVYNKPGTSGQNNWALRLPDNFKELHQIDLPKILARALIAREIDDKKLIEELNEI